jgi:hypothetical protein
MTVPSRLDWFSVWPRRRALLPGAAHNRLNSAEPFEPSRSQKIVGAKRRIF